MKIKSVLLPIILASGLIACDSDTVEVISVGDSSGNNESTDGSDTNGDADNNDGSTDSDGSTDNVDSTDGSDTADSANSDGILTDPARLLSLVGLVKVEATNTESDFSRGVFTELDTALTAESILEFFVPENDLCIVTTYNAAFPPGNAFRIYDQEPTLISAGESITLTSSAGTYATLERQVVPPTGLIYRSNTELDDNIPDGLVLDVPGEVFPGFASVALSNVPALQVTSPTAQLTETTEFVWNANDGDPLSVFEIYAGFTSPETNQVIEVGCTVIDDGQFSFDETTRAALGEGYTANWFSFLRVVYDVAESDNAILFVANSVD